MNNVINPSIVKSVHEKILTEGRPSNSGIFLKGVYASIKDPHRKELSDRFSRIAVENGKVVESEFDNSTQRTKFLSKIRKLHRQQNAN